VTTKLIEANTTIPTRAQETFSTAADNQTSVEIHVLQGEREMARDNRTIGRFHLDGLPPAPRGVPQIEVTFDIDADGILNVSAKDKATGKEQSIRIEASSGLTEEEINKMQEDAKAHAEEDKKKRERIEVKNQADSLAYSTQKNLDEYGEKISDESRSTIESALERLNEVKEQEDAETSAIQSAMDELNEVWNNASQELYQAQQEAAEAAQEAQAEGGGNGAAAEGDVTDADYEVVDEEGEQK